MKVCHLTSVHQESDTRIFVKECMSLAQAGFNVSYIVPSEIEEEIEVNNIRVYKIAKVKNSRIKRMTKTVWNVYRKALEIDADVYHFHDPELIVVGRKLMKKGKKVIYDVHEDVPKQILNKTWLPFNSQKLVSFLFAKYESRAMKEFSLVIAATPYIKNQIENNGVKAININNFPIVDELKVIRNASAESEVFPFVCYAGSISGIRGLKEMVLAIENIENVKLLLAGEFAYKSEREDIKKMKGWTNVEELGFLNRKAIKEVYSKSFAGLVLLHPHTNYLDSLPVKMFEYMAAGIPVIASNFPYWKKIIEENNCGICVDPYDINKITDAIEFLRTNKDIAFQMGKNGQRAINNKYNWNQESEKLINAYQVLKEEG